MSFPGLRRWLAEAPFRDAVFRARREAFGPAIWLTQRYAAVVRRLRRFQVAGVVVEATGRYERVVAGALYAAGFPLAVINPRRSKHFAKALNYQSKTDAVDAAVLARYAKLVRPPPRPPVPATQVRLGDLVVRRRQLIAMRTAEESRLECRECDEAARSIRQTM